MHCIPQTRESIIAAAKALAAELGTSELNRREFERRTGVGHYHIYKLFPDGGWSEVVTAAGLLRHRRFDESIPDDHLLEEFHRVVADLGEIPTLARFSAKANISSSALARRFGGMRGTVTAYREWLAAKEPDSPLLGAIGPATRREGSADVRRHPAPASERPPVQWSKSEGIEYGAPINFRGLRHAPINEQGVVYLFGMVSHELGFLVEAVHTSFPDCEAKRCIDRQRNRWQRVRIEFEYRSSTFLGHGHSPDGCEIVVCWEHDWPECPLEVVELRRVIQTLEG